MTTLIWKPENQKKNFSQGENNNNYFSSKMGENNKNYFPPKMGEN